MSKLPTLMDTLASNFARSVLDAVRSARLVDVVGGQVSGRVPSPKSRPVGIHDVAREWSTQYRLSPAELEILVAAAEGTSRKELLVMRNVAASTLKRQVFTLIRKTGDASLLHAVARLLRQALDNRSKSQRSRQRR